MLAHRVSGAVICLSFSHAEDEKIARIIFFAGEMERKGVNIKPRCLLCSRILSVVRRRNIPTIFSLIPYLLRINAKKKCCKALPTGRMKILARKDARKRKQAKCSTFYTFSFATFRYLARFAATSTQGWKWVPL